MSRKTIGLSDELQAYMLDHSSLAPDEVLRDLATETLDMVGEDLIRLQIAPEQGAFLTLLVRLLGARTAVEVGTFTGYSSVCIARGLPADGRLVCFDNSEEWTSVARRYWERAGLTDRVELRLADATTELGHLPADPPVDFAFIDADKGNYPRYYEMVLQRLAPDGLIVVDNVFSGERVLNEEKDENAAAIAAFNEQVANDERVDVVMVPIADGLSLITPRS